MRTLTIRWSWFTVLKYAVYAVLVINLVLFWFEDLGSFRQMDTGALSLSDLLGIFAQTLDTAAWVVLLLLFELETAVLADEALTPRVERSLHVARFICAGAIVYAFFGYLTKALGLADFVTLDALDACALAPGFEAMVRLDGYEPVTAANCAAFVSPLLTLPGTTLLATLQDHLMATRLAWLDVINAGAWILIVVMLEVDVRVTEHHRQPFTWQRLSRAFKGMLYTVLFVAAVLWGLAGTWLDFVDASLWLFAFFCIELNVFAWAQETAPRSIITSGAATG
jgi:hypothetical protein